MAEWRTSSFSDTGNCVEIAFGDRVGVRDSKDGSGPLLNFPVSGWDAFLDAAAFDQG